MDLNNATGEQLQAHVNAMVNDAVGHEIGALTIARISAEANLSIAGQRLQALEATLEATRAELVAAKAAAEAQSSKPKK